MTVIFSQNKSPKTCKSWGFNNIPTVDGAGLGHLVGTTGNGAKYPQVASGVKMYLPLLVDILKYDTR